MTAFLLSAALLVQAALPSFAEPGISPDGREIAFVSAGDIWTVPATGGEARLLVAHPAVESRPLYSPDGRHLAFVSNRAGSNDIWILELASGAVRQLTFEDGSEGLDGWSADGQWVYYSSSSRDIAGMNDVYKVPLAGGTPVPVSADRYLSEYWSAPAPDGQRVAITARGTRTGQWWRRGSSHIDQSEIWLVRPGATPQYEQVRTMGDAWEAWPMWAPDGRALYYMSDHGGNQNLWTVTLGGTAEPLTRFRTGRVLWPSISRDGRMIAFERDFGIWTYEIASRAVREVPITLRGAAAVAGVERRVTTNEVQEYALSPDGRKVAFTVRGELFAASARDGGRAERVTRTAAQETQVSWAPDSRRLAYASWRHGTLDLFLYDFGTGTETQLTRAAVNEVTPRFSPDGKQLAFVRDGRELRVLDLETGRDRVLATGMLDRAPFVSARGFEWSRDGKWIAYLAGGLKGFLNAWVVPVAGGEPRQATFLSNVFGGSIAWGGDGTFLLFDSRQRTEPGQLIRVDLSPRTPVFAEDRFRDLFNQETPRPQPGNAAAPRPAAAADTTRDPPRPFDFEEIRRRVSTIQVNVDLTTLAVSPDGKWVVMVAGAAGQQNLYAWPLDETATEAPAIRQLTSTAGGKSQLAWSPDSKEVYFLTQGRISAYHMDTRNTRTVSVTTEMNVDFATEKLAVFEQAWAYKRDGFYDPQYHGVDWGAVRTTYAPRIAGARTPDEMRRILSLMVGELNASHLGISAPGGGSQPAPTGRLGLRFDPVLLERGQFRITEVIPLSPAAIGGVRTGEYLQSVDGVTLNARVNLDSLLSGTVNRRVALRVGAQATGQGREVVVRPVSTGTEKGLLYRAWVEDRRAYVERVSNGRLGYVHMPDMSQTSLTQLYLDLDEQNHGREGVVIDIRNNNGGFVHAYALDVFSRQPYLTMTNRGREPAPARTQLGQRALEKPTILVTNQHSLSDAEDFSEGYRAMGLGKIVGEPTSGWIIYTSNLPLVDGTVMRLPFIRIQGADGQDMELHPRPVDILVRRPVGESYTGRDSQLDRAVAELLAGGR